MLLDRERAGVQGHTADSIIVASADDADAAAGCKHTASDGSRHRRSPVHTACSDV